MVTLVEGYVWCDSVGEVHEDIPDPLGIGPYYTEPDDEFDRPNWEMREQDPWPGKLWHYTCPGPHHLLWMGREIRKEEK